MDISVEAVAQADRLSYQFLVAPPSNPEREVGAAVWAEMVAGYFGVASPAVRESGALGVRVFVRKDGGELRIGKYGWQALGEGVQNKDGVRTQENMIARSNRAFQTGIGPDPYPSPAPPRAAEGVSGWRS